MPSSFLLFCAASFQFSFFLSLSIFFSSRSSLSLLHIFMFSVSCCSGGAVHRQRLTVATPARLERTGHRENWQQRRLGLCEARRRRQNRSVVVLRTGNPSWARCGLISTARAGRCWAHGEDAVVVMHEVGWALGLIMAAVRSFAASRFRRRGVRPGHVVVLGVNDAGKETWPDLDRCGLD